MCKHVIFKSGKVVSMSKEKIRVSALKIDVKTVSVSKILVLKKFFLSVSKKIGLKKVPVLVSTVLVTKKVSVLV